MRNVLIALDYDPSAQKIAEMGYSLAQSINADVVLTHIVLDPSLYSVSYLELGPLQLEGFECIKDVAKQFLENVRQNLGDDTIELNVEEGNCANTILNVAKSKGVEFIVMGSHSQSWIANKLLGSVTESVLRQTAIPLFIIPNKKTL